MGRIMAIDPGSKRVGLAVTDPEGIIASGLTTVASHKVFPFLKDYVKKENVTRFVVGEPRRMNGEPAAFSEKADEFVAALQNKFPDIAVERVDERFTSVMAEKAIKESGTRKSQRKNKGLVDKVSATIILRSYLDIV